MARVDLAVLGIFAILSLGFSTVSWSGFSTVSLGSLVGMRTK